MRHFTGDDRATVDTSAYKSVQVDFHLVNGTCFGSGASLLIVEATDFAERGRVTANDACIGGYTGFLLEVPSRSLEFIVHVANAGDLWHVTAFGRSN